MNQDIGYAAGEIWRFLDQQSALVTLSAIKRNVATSSTLLMMGLGWLAKENKLRIETADNSSAYRISLNR